MSDDIDIFQEGMTHLDITELAKRCSEQEKRYCEARIYHLKNIKEAMRSAGSQAKEEYLSKLGWQTEQRAHVQAYMEELRKIRTSDASIALQEIIFKTRRGIDSVLEGKTPEKVEPLLRLLSELGGYLKTNAPAASATQVNVKVEAKDGIEGDILRLQRLTQE